MLLPLVSSLVPAKHFLIETEEGGQAKMMSDNRAIFNQWKPSKFYRENLSHGMAQTRVTNGDDDGNSEEKPGSQKPYIPFNNFHPTKLPGC